MKRRIFLCIKRIFDIVVSLVALIILAIPMAIVAILIKIEEESKLPAIILLAILGTCIIGLGIYIVVKNRK